MFRHLTVVILSAKNAGRLLAISGQKRKQTLNTFLADKNQWMVFVCKVLDPTSEHRVWPTPTLQSFAGAPTVNSVTEGFSNKHLHFQNTSICILPEYQYCEFIVSAILEFSDFSIGGD